MSGEAELSANLTDYAYSLYKMDRNDQLNNNAYLKDYEFKKSKWDEGLSFHESLIMHKSEVFGFVAIHGKKSFVILRGTQNPKDWISNLKVRQSKYEPVHKVACLEKYSPKLHNGFNDIYKGIRGQVFRVLFPSDSGEATIVSGRQEIVVAGHSMGAAVATPLALDIAFADRENLVRLYTFASPRIGDPFFSACFNESEIKAYRIFNTEDLVPQVPAAIMPKVPIGIIGNPLVVHKELYLHVGVPIPFTIQRGTIVKNHSSVTFLRIWSDMGISL
jgi:triacylglycerol lipase